MVRNRLGMATGVLFTLAGVGLVAFADPDPTVAGKYALEGNQGGKHTKVALTVGADGAVSRAVTFDDGRSESTNGAGTFTDARTLRVTFASADAPSDPAAPADPNDLTGTWTFTGRNGVGSYKGSGTFAKVDGVWKGVFSYHYSNGNGDGSCLLTGDVRDGAFVGSRLRTTGMTGALGGASGLTPYPVRYALTKKGLQLSGGYGPGNKFTETFKRPSLNSGSTAPVNGSMKGVYSFDGQGGVTGNLTNSTGTGNWTSATESGKKSDDDAKLAIVAPADGTGVLAGQLVDVKATPENASWDVSSGPARKTADGRLQVTGDGSVVLVAKLDSRQSDPVTVKAVKPEVVALEVQNTQPISDAQPPHLKRDLGSNAQPVTQPAAILINEKLVVKATLQAALDLGVAAKVKVTATGDKVRLSGEGQIAALKAGDSVTLTSDAPLSRTIDVNKLSLSFSLEQDGATSVSLGSALPLRVYTLFKPTIKNGPYYGEASRPIPTKDHLEKSCTWAAGTSENVGNGDSSICWKLDNYVRHHVHPVDFKKNSMPFTSAYPLDSTTPPLNYADLDDAWSARSSGERGTGQLYYPPLDVRDPAKEDYSHYSSNFGWWVLDNPTHTGGRCNQQASLMCDLFGTHGIQAHVHYLQRVGMSNSGRPVRQYFNSEKGEMYWNFHGLAEAIMADGQHWLYDGSFSFAPNRKNGLTEWAEAPGRWLHQSTPFIYEFGPWYYEDFGGIVPDNDIPSVHVDSDNPGAGQFNGVPQAKGETLNWYNHAKHNADGTVH